VSKAVAQFGLENTIRNPWPPKGYLTPFSLTDTVPPHRSPSLLQELRHEAGNAQYHRSDRHADNVAR
jgi:hypothetical protein